jgi:hypothetical protein
MNASVADDPANDCIIGGHTVWYKVKNRAYTQMERRGELFHPGPGTPQSVSVCKLLCELHPIILHISDSPAVHPAHVPLWIQREPTEMFASA